MAARFQGALHFDGLPVCAKIVTNEKSHEGRKLHLLQPFHFKDNIFGNFDEAAKLCKASHDDYNCGTWQVLQDLLNKRVAEGAALNPHDFTNDVNR